MRIKQKCDEINKQKKTVTITKRVVLSLSEEIILIISYNAKILFQSQLRYPKCSYAKGLYVRKRVTTTIFTYLTSKNALL